MSAFCQVSPERHALQTSNVLLKCAGHVSLRHLSNQRMSVLCGARDTGRACALTFFVEHATQFFVEHATQSGLARKQAEGASVGSCDATHGVGGTLENTVSQVGGSTVNIHLLYQTVVGSLKCSQNRQKSERYCLW